VGLSEFRLGIVVVAMSLTALLLGVALADESIVQMVGAWDAEEYNHSFLIPVIAAMLFYQKLPALNYLTLSPSWLGVAATVLVIALLVVGELSALFTIVQYAFVGIVVAICLTAIGLRASLIMWAPLIYLLFMVPLPNFLLNNLSQSLQLISSEIGVFVIRLFGISVYLEGNVIDLGSYQLQVVEACSGLRYLFPLSSFGFLIAYLFQAPLWQRALIFVSTAPITVLMNSFRIGVIGVLVEHWGIGQAEGFLHLFEGWIIFIACLAILVLEIFLLHKLTRATGSMWDRLDLSFPEISEISLKYEHGGTARAPLVVVIGLLIAALIGTNSLESRDEIRPERGQFVQFPLLHEKWIGREGSIESDVLETLKLTDYIMADYSSSEFVLPVNFYVAYYESQRKGASVHSPRSCIPGGGWEIQSLDQVVVDRGLNMTPIEALPPLEVNRVIIQKGENRQLVYYWFQQRGRILTNEYLVKWYLFWDALNRNRTDGSLVRLVIPVPDGFEMVEAERQLQAFIRDFHALMGRYIPD